MSLEHVVGDWAASEVSAVIYLCFTFPMLRPIKFGSCSRSLIVVFHSSFEKRVSCLESVACRCTMFVILFSFKKI
jgi:hypothetical protein